MYEQEYNTEMQARECEDMARQYEQEIEDRQNYSVMAEEFCVSYLQTGSDKPISESEDA